MPKVKKIRAPALQSSTPSASRRGGHEQPLGQIIQDDTNRNLYATTKSNRSSSQSAMIKNKSNNNIDMHDEYYDDDDIDNTAATARDVVLDEKSSQRIIALSIEQQKEIRQAEIIQNTTAAAAATATSTMMMMTTKKKKTGQPQSRNSHTPNKTMDDSDDEDEEEDDTHLNGDNDDDDDDDNNNNNNNSNFQYADRIDNGEYVDMVDTSIMGISPEDEAIIATMMKGRNMTTSVTSGNSHNQHPTQPTLADMILEKIAQKEQQQQQRGNRNNNDGDDDNDMMSQPPDELPPKVIEVYTDIGKILSRYTSGKLPKAFKVIPSLSNWEDVLYITRPDLWTPAAMYAATRIFASNCNVKMATKFYNLVLLDSIRNDIYKNKKLNYHYYMSLKKSIYKPQSFFKGILLPLCQENCTLREAAIVASVLQRISIPVHHAAVAIHKLATMHQVETTSAVLMSEYSGATSIFLKTLFNKKYSLPAPVISSVIRYFTNFLHHHNTNSHNKSNGLPAATTSASTIVLPVLWHQALLVFIQRYKNAISMDDTSTRETFRKLLKQHYHHKITPEIRRELFGSIQAYQEELREKTISKGTGSVPTNIISQQAMEM